MNSGPGLPSKGQEGRTEEMGPYKIEVANELTGHRQVRKASLHETFDAAEKVASAEANRCRSFVIL